MIRFTTAQRIRKGKPRKANRQKSVLDKLNAFLTAKEPEAIAFLVSFWDSQTRAVTYQELREAYLSGGITQAQFERWQQDYSELVRNQLYPQWQEAANAAAAEIQAKYPHFYYEPAVSSSMDYIRKHGAELVTNLTQEQRSAVNAVIARVSGYTAVTVDEAARIIRPVIGLTKLQAIANTRYRESVKQAYLSAHPKGKIETAEKKAAEAAARYAARQHRYRAQNIARTELAYAYNAGAYGATKDAQRRGYLGPCEKIWMTAANEKVCPLCQDLEGERRPMDAPFSIGVEFPPAHPSCRCAIAYEEIPSAGLTTTPTSDTIDNNVDQGSAGMLFDEQRGQFAGPEQDTGGISSQNPGEIIQTGTVDFWAKSAVLQQLRQAQIDFAGLDYEMNCTVTSDGKVWRVSGTSGQVNPWGIEELGSRLQGSYSYHNHPVAKTWYSFSADDVRFFFASGAECSMASDDLYVYMMRRTKDTVEISPDMVYSRFSEILHNEVFALKWAGDIDPDTDEYHAVMEILSKELKFDYVRKNKA